MEIGEEVLVACHPAHSRAQQCVVLARLQKARDVLDGPFGPGVILQSTWDGKPVPDALVPYAFARPQPPEPK
jgi:hypothetical protein